nr:MAG TPA: hypothetical protein [Caudoviricetes sp.]
MLLFHRLLITHIIFSDTNLFLKFLSLYLLFSFRVSFAEQSSQIFL